MTLRAFYLVLAYAAGIAALASAVCAGYYWSRARRQRQWEERLAKVKRELAELELQQITAGYYVPPKGRQAVN